MTVRLAFPQRLYDELAGHARAAFPAECCGLIEGTQAGARFEALALHPAGNARSEEDRFEIDPAMHITLLRSLRGTGRAVIGCYHSHPRGRPLPSARDRENGGTADFLWLIAAIAGPAAEIDLAAFVGEAFEGVEIGPAL